MRRGFRHLRVLVMKDLRIEFRGKQLVMTTTTLGVLLIVLMGMALDGASNLPDAWASGVLWVCVFFTASVSLNRHDAKDRELDAVLGISMAPIDRSLAYYAKWISTSCVVLITECVLTGAFFLIVGEHVPLHPLEFMGVLCAGAIGITGIGTFLATLAAGSSMRDLLVPILLFPLAIPLFLALIRLTMSTLTPGSHAAGVWGEVLFGYMAAFAVLPWLLYEPLMEV